MVPPSTRRTVSAPSAEPRLRLTCLRVGLFFRLTPMTSDFVGNFSKKSESSEALTGHGSMSNSSETSTILSNASVGEVLFDASKPKPVAQEVIPERDGSWNSPGVSAEGKARAQSDEQAAIDAGFTVAPPIYEIGSLVNQTGVENFRSSREEFEKMPTAVEVCRNLAQQIKSEDRRDIVLAVPELKMLDNGQLTRGTGNGMTMSERAMTGLATHVTPGGAGYLRECPSELRAINVNHWCENGTREDVRATNKLMKAWQEGQCRGPQPAPVIVPRELTLRTRINGTDGNRENYAIVGPRYAAHDIDKIAEQVMTSDAIPADARARVTYDGYRSRIDVLFHSNVQPERVVAGEIFKAGILLKTADDGSGSIQIAAQLWRNLCLNLIIVDHAKDMVMRRSHRGGGIGEAVEQGIRDAMKKVEYFCQKWSEATLENVLEKYGVDNIEAVFRGLIFNKVVHVPGVKPEVMMQRLMGAWAKEQGNDKTAIVNAITRAAHSHTWKRWTIVEELETLGGKLLFAPNWNVTIPEKVDLAKLGY
jgi:hypothetical protein